MSSNAEGGGAAAASNGGMLYHEVQESKLCAVHCVNTVLQGPFFSEFDLAALASDLDRTERQMMLGAVTGDFLPELSHNVSLDGDFSIQVLQKALEVWDLQVIPLDSPVAEPAQIDPEKENAFICHLQDHWFCIRKVNGEWYNFDSLYPAPEHLSKFYLSAYLDSLKGFGWSIFLVRGNFPKECPITSSEASNGFGQWLLPEDAERITKSCNTASRNRTGQQQQQQQQLSDPYMQYDNSQMWLDDEDEDLKAAIAASLMESSLPAAAMTVAPPVAATTAAPPVAAMTAAPPAAATTAAPPAAATTAAPPVAATTAAATTATMATTATETQPGSSENEKNISEEKKE